MKRASPRLLLIGGVDSSGRAGLDADRDAARAFDARLDVFESARTVQDDAAVHSVEPVLHWWYDAGYVVEDGVDAVKIGLLPDADAVAGVAQLAGHARSAGLDLPVVIDPVIAASSGTRFWGAAEVAAFRRQVLPLGPVLTPNLAELAELAEVDPASLAADLAAREEAARVLLRAGARAVVVTGGHGEGDLVVDLAVPIGAPAIAVERARVAGPGLRGTGCRFATALACGLALHQALDEAARAAGELVARRIREAAAR